MGVGVVEVSTNSCAIFTAFLVCGAPMPTTMFDQLFYHDASSLLRLNFMVE